MQSNCTQNDLILQAFVFVVINFHCRTKSTLAASHSSFFNSKTICISFYKTYTSSLFYKLLFTLKFVIIYHRVGMITPYICQPASLQKCIDLFGLERWHKIFEKRIWYYGCFLFTFYSSSTCRPCFPSNCNGFSFFIYWKRIHCLISY